MITAVETAVRGGLGEFLSKLVDITRIFSANTCQLKRGKILFQLPRRVSKESLYLIKGTKKVNREEFGFRGGREEEGEEFDEYLSP